MEPAVFRLPCGVDAPALARAVDAEWDGAVLRRRRAAISMAAGPEDRLWLAREWRWPWQWRGDDDLEGDMVRALSRHGARADNGVAEAYLRGARRRSADD
jgi:hypothetical protein